MTKAANLFRFVRYGLVGAVGTLVQYAILVAMVSAHLAQPATASMVGAVAGAIVNYLLNARFTFDQTPHAQALPKFALTAVLGAALNGILMKIFVDVLGMHYLLAQVGATVIVLGLTYSINALWTFRSAESGLRPKDAVD
jgi:putative flippase GtrA